MYCILHDRINHLIKADRVLCHYTEICASYTNLSDPWRHHNLGRYGGMTDSNLTEGWYRFIGVGGDVLYSLFCRDCGDPGYSGLQESRVYKLRLCSYTYYSNWQCSHTGETVDVLLCPSGFYLHKLFPKDEPFLTGKI